MENILNKALSEVLTPRWSEELRDAYDTGYKFSDGFELKMRDLIRKTDRPKSRYIGYFAAAACAVIAIGSAIIVPTLMRSPVEVAEPEQTTVTVTENTTAASQTIVTTTTASESSITTAESTAPDVTETTSVSSEPDISVPAETTSDTTVVITTAEPEVTGDEIDDEPVIDDDSDVENNGSQIIVDMDDDVDDDIVIDDEPIYDAPDDDIYVEKKVYDLPAPEQGETLSELFAENFPQADLDDIWAERCYYYPDGKKESEYYFMTNHAEYEFLHEFVQKLGDAKCDTVHPETDSTEYIDITVKNGKPFIEQNTPSNNSVWTRYSELYGIDDDKEYIDEDEYLGDDIDEIICFTVRVYNNNGQDFGKVKLIDEIIYGSKWRGEDKLYKFPDDSTVFTMDGEVIERLFEGLHGLLLPDDPKTVGDINDKMNITAGNIYQAYTDVKELYDTSVVKGLTDIVYLEGFIDRYKDRPVKQCYGTGASEDCYPEGQIFFDIWFRNSAHLYIYLNVNGYCYIYGGRRAYRFKYDEGEIQRAMKVFSDVNGYDILIFDTLSEYLENKNFNKIDSIAVKGWKGRNRKDYFVNERKDLNKIYKLLADIFKDSHYLLNPYEEQENEDTDDETAADTEAESYEEIVINVLVYDGVSISISPKEDILWLNDGDILAFRLPDGSFEKIAEAVKNSESVITDTDNGDIDDDRNDTVVPIEDDEIDD